MVRSLVDSDILSEILKGKNRQVEANKTAYAAEFSQLTFTSATVLEVLYGLERIGARAQLQRAEALFAKHEEIPPTPQDYRLAAEIAGALDRQGTHVGLIDPLIAACAIRRGLAVATGNVSHFSYMRRAGYQFVLYNWHEI